MLAYAYSEMVRLFSKFGVSSDFSPSFAMLPNPLNNVQNYCSCRFVGGVGSEDFAGGLRNTDGCPLTTGGNDEAAKRDG